MRNLTEDELKLAPDWATHYIVDSDGSIIYESEKLCWWVGRREPLDNEGSFGNSSNRAINTFNITQHEVANHITVLEKGYETMETLEELKAIIDNAPTDATHACVENGTHYQFKVVGLNAEIYTGDGWLCYSGCALPDLCGVRLISDIKRIIELMEINQDMHITVAGYLYGKDWAHWNEFNAGKYKL